MQASFELREEFFFDCVRQNSEASAQLKKYASRYDALVQRLFEASGRMVASRAVEDGRGWSELAISCPTLFTQAYVNMLCLKICVDY